MNIPNAVKREVYKLVPISIQKDITSFVFNDYKIKHKSPPEIIVATKHGEILECSNKIIQRSIEIDDNIITEIVMYYCCKGYIYYVVSTVSKLFVISTNEDLRIVCFVNDLDRYEINDFMCSGTAYLQVWSKGNAVPLTFDDYMERFIDEGYVDKHVSQSDDRFTSEGRRNRNAMEYLIAQNEETLKKVVALRHMLAFTSNTNLQDSQPSTCSDTISGDGSKDWMKVVHKNRKDLDVNRTVFIVKDKKPWIKQYNTNIILGVEIKNHSKSPMEPQMIVLCSWNSQKSQLAIINTETI